MTLWGNSPTSNHNKPIYVKTRSYQVGDIANVYATNRGWEVKRKDLHVETLVAIANLAYQMANANVTSIEWSFANVARAAGGVWVSFDEEVVLLGGGAPTLNIALTNSATTPVTTATYSKGNGNNRLFFTFTAPLGGIANVSNGAALVISNGSFLITANAGTTINDKVGGNVAYLTASNAVPFAAGQIPYLNLANANITAIAFAATTFVNNAAVSNVVVTYDQDVIIIGTNTPTFNIAVSNSNTAGLNLIASYVAGNISGNLTFQYTAPNLATANVANNPRLSVLSSTAVVANTNDTLNGATTGKVAILAPTAGVVANVATIAVR